MNTPELALPDDYPHLLAELKAQIRSAQWTAARVVNTALIELYWGIGKAILERQSAEGWGTQVIDRLSDDLRVAYPEMRGLSPSNIQYMRKMAATWPESAISPQAVGKLPWGHVRVLLDKLNEPAARDWYARAAVAGGWSRGQLQEVAGNQPATGELGARRADWVRQSSQVHIRDVPQPVAHDPRGLRAVTDDELLQLLTVISMAHRRLDSAQPGSRKL